MPEKKNRSERGHAFHFVSLMGVLPKRDKEKEGQAIRPKRVLVSMIM